MVALLPSPRRTCATLLPLLCLACGSADQVAPPELPPNFLVFDIDSMRYDRLDASRRAQTPSLHGLVDRGVVFDAAYASSGWTAPALATLLLGGFPPLEHVTVADGRAWAPTVRGLPTLPEVLGYYGYHTAAFWGGTGKGILSDSGRGFEHSESWSEQGGTSYDLDVTTWLRQQAEPPFFAFVHNIDLHHPRPPMGPPPPGASITPPPHCMLELFGDQARRRLASQDPLEKARLQAERYDCGLLYYDRSIGRILGALDSAGFAHNTVIVVTSNHGELLLEHNVVGHELLYDPVLHIPLVVVDPRQAESRRVSQPVELQDIAPTLLSWAGATVPREMQGRSLVPLLEQSGTIPDLTALFALSNRGNAAIRSDGFKLIHADDSLPDGGTKFTFSGQPRQGSWSELYDLQADPDELVDLSAARPDLTAELSARLEAWVSPRYAESDQPLPAMDQALERELKERGYWEAVAEPDGGS
jgi:arylsulfatase